MRRARPVIFRNSLPLSVFGSSATPWIVGVHRPESRHPSGTATRFLRSMRMIKPDFDCLIVGGGPAGLTAAIYLARFHLSLKVVDAGEGRARLIPCTHNHAGFPNGISGQELIGRMREHAQRYGAAIETGRVSRLDRHDIGFEAEWGSGSVVVRAVLMATGVTNRRPMIDEDLHEQALARGLIRYCPVCDGYEVTDRTLAVIGSGSRGTTEALFLRGYTKNVTLISPDGKHALGDDERNELTRYGIEIVDGPCRVAAIESDQIVIEIPGDRRTFESIYPALGSDTHTDLAESLGARVSSESACIIVDDHQRTSVDGLYAAGDVVLGLDQISHAMGQGGVAATTIRNDLAREWPILR